MVNAFVDDTKIGGIVDNEEDRVLKKAFSTLAFIAQTIEYRSWDITLRLYRMLVRPLLEAFDNMRLELWPGFGIASQVTLALCHHLACMAGGKGSKSALIGKGIAAEKVTKNNRVS
eukprot:g40181.t1